MTPDSMRRAAHILTRLATWEDDPDDARDMRHLAHQLQTEAQLRLTPGLRPAVALLIHRARLLLAQLRAVPTVDTQACALAAADLEAATATAEQAITAAP
jgi:hypothetical protein